MAKNKTFLSVRAKLFCSCSLETPCVYLYFLLFIYSQRHLLGKVTLHSMMQRILDRQSLGKNYIKFTENTWNLVYTFSSFFYFQSEAFTGEGEVTFYDADDLDVQWYGRQCSRFQRNITLPGEEEKYSDILGRQKLNKEYPG